MSRKDSNPLAQKIKIYRKHNDVAVKNGRGHGALSTWLVDDSKVDALLSMVIREVADGKGIQNAGRS